MTAKTTGQAERLRPLSASVGGKAGFNVASLRSAGYIVSRSVSHEPSEGILPLLVGDYRAMSL